MKVAALSLICLCMALGVALGAGYGGYGYGNYVPVYPSYGGQQSGGFGNGGFLMLIGLLFLITILFSGNLFNTTSASTPITLVQG